MPAGVAEYLSTGTGNIAFDDLELMPGLIWAEEVREERTAGGLILPDVDDAQKVRIARCIRRGPGEPDDKGGAKPIFIRTGDFFLFGKYQSGGEPIKLGDKLVLQFRQGDIVAKWHNPAQIAAVAASMKAA